MNRTILSLLVLLACVVGLLVQCRRGRHPEARVHRAYMQAPGLGLGRQLAKDLPDGGTVVMLIPGCDDETRRDRYEPQAEGIRQGYGKGRLLVLVENGEGPSAPARSAHDMIGMPNRSLLDIQGVARRHPGAAALVVFATPDELPPAEVRAALPPLYVIDPSANPRWPTLLQAGGRVRAVVVRNPETDLLSAQPQEDAEGILDLRYRVLTPPADAT